MAMKRQKCRNLQMSAKYANGSQCAVKIRQKQIKKRARNVPKNAVIAQKCRSCRPGRAEGISKGKSEAAPLADTCRPSPLSPSLLSQLEAANIRLARVPGCLGGVLQASPGRRSAAEPPGGAPQHLLAVGVSGRSPDVSEAKLCQRLLLFVPAAAFRALRASQPLPGMNAAQAYADRGAPSRPDKQIGPSSCCSAALKPGRSEGFDLGKEQSGFPKLKPADRPLGVGRGACTSLVYTRGQMKKN